METGIDQCRPWFLRGGTTADIVGYWPCPVKAKGAHQAHEIRAKNGSDKAFRGVFFPNLTGYYGCGVNLWTRLPEE